MSRLKVGVGTVPKEYVILSFWSIDQQPSYLCTVVNRSDITVYMLQRGRFSFEIGEICY